MSLWQRYVDAFQKDLGYRAVWEPGTELDVGDYGEWVGGRWLRLGSIWERSGLTPQEAITESQPGMFQMGSASVSDIRTSAALGVVDAEVSISFSSDHSLFVRATGSSIRSFRDLYSTAVRILRQWPEWEKRWLLVSSVRTAQSFSVVGGSGSGESVVVRAPIPDLQAFLAGGKANAALQMNGGVDISFMGECGPIHYELVRIKTGWAGGTVVKRGIGGTKEDAVAMAMPVGVGEESFGEQ